MSRAFYPFVEEGMDDDVKARYATRIAVYDDAAAAPRVVVIDPSDVRSYLEEITSEVSRLAREMGGRIPFMVIREVVENLIHAYFIEPAISILDNGDTIRFADQGPGIKEKTRALEYGTTSATEEMKKYIRGVGSGLPYAQQYLQDHGGDLHIEDNISGGTIVTISMVPERHSEVFRVQPVAGASLMQQNQAALSHMMPDYAPQGMQQAPAGYPANYGQPMPQGYPPQQAAPQQGTPQTQTIPGIPLMQPTPTPWNAQAGIPAWPAQGSDMQGAPVNQGAYPQQPTQQAQGEQGAGTSRPAIELSGRAEQILAYLAEHESVGPTDLVDAYGSSQPTWTRELQALEKDGIVNKRGQKRVLTPMGKTLL